MYLLSEVQKVYRSQGQNINDKHFEIIIRNVIRKVLITRPGDTNYLPGDQVDLLELRYVNEQLLSEGKRPAKFIEAFAGITKVLEVQTGSFPPRHSSTPSRCWPRLRLPLPKILSMDLRRMSSSESLSQQEPALYAAVLMSPFSPPREIFPSPPLRQPKRTT